jgi:phosphoribosylaminoimidazole-succinocarboxamide synthase
MFFMKKSIQTTEFKDLNLIGRGKVRDIYSVKNYLLIVTTDRISAFDVIMPNPVPGKRHYSKSHVRLLV